MNATPSRDIATSPGERVIEVVVRLMLGAAVVLWALPVAVPDMGRVYLMAPACAAVGTLLADWVLVWGTDEDHYQRVVDRRVIAGLSSLGLIFRAWAHDPVFNQALHGHGYWTSLVASGLVLGGAIASLVAVIVHGAGWHIAGSLAGERGTGELPAKFKEALRAYPTGLAGGPRSWRRAVLALVVASTAAAALYSMTLHSSSDGLLMLSLFLISTGILEWLQRVLFSRG